MKLLVATSLLFFTNFIHNTWYREFIYAWLFLLLSSTSFFVHSGTFKEESLHFHDKIIVIDKIIILSIFCYGLYIYLKTGTSIYPILSVVTVAFIYLGIYNCHQEDVILNHMAMHIIGCLGHHSIIYDYGYYTEIQRSIQNMVKRQYQ